MCFKIFFPSNLLYPPINSNTFKTEFICPFRLFTFNKKVKTYHPPPHCLTMSSDMNVSDIMSDDSNDTSGINDTFLDDFCAAEQLLIDTTPIQLVFCLMYLIIFCLGVFGNLLVSVVVIKNKAMHTVTNLFILNLAISDVVMCLFAVPFTPLQSFTGKWLFGEALCILFPFSQGVSVYISTLTLTIIALDRLVQPSTRTHICCFTDVSNILVRF
jgi:hypothetical protein